MVSKYTLDYAKRLDEKDILKSFREEFYLKPDTIYMDGNSLGLLSKRAERTLLESLEDWKNTGLTDGLKGITHGFTWQRNCPRRLHN